MVTRACVYKDCDFYQSANCQKVRPLFSCSKNPERARIWRENGRVHPKIPPQQLLMCSKHFDPSFISMTKNRALLVGEAVPYPYKEPETVTTLDQVLQFEAEDFDQVASTSTAQENYYISLNDDEQSIITVESTTKSKDKKDICLESSSPKRSKKSPTVPAVKETPSDSKEKVSNDDGIDTSEVSLFNFKGEQYVQMSLEYYLKEKRELADQLKVYKEILRSIKKQISPLDV
ncbi:uncharacterized protein Dlip2 isoform X1 [Drosophila bipectinata]|uniref:uncharacterized protein Dlip2 isoform X1 n=1 Tax=Drosophila bipectinata TaxID=42026 RepID=UPI001C89F335|nr:uncharacterized protein LOC108128822 [Drosophila bipectinata]